jgi:hypothetical protein
MVQTATAASIGPFRTIPDVRHALEGWSDAEVLAAIDARRAGTPVEQGPVRTAEFGQFMAAPEEVPGTIAPSGQDFFARRLRRDRAPPAAIERVVLASKLREVRAQVGFTRLMPVSSDLQGEYKVVPAALGLQTDWLPATEVRGEGIFVRLDEEAVQAWEQRPEVRQREAELRAGFARWSEQVKEPPEFPGVRFYLLHSMAHLLMTALSLECGYSASAIRERLYCSLPGDDVPMAGILLATGSSGTDGTLGGLVDQGRRLPGAPARSVGCGGAVLQRSGVRASHAEGRPHRAAAGGSGVPRVPLRGGVFLRALQPVPRSGAGGSDAGV